MPAKRSKFPSVTIPVLDSTYSGHFNPCKFDTIGAWERVDRNNESCVHYYVESVSLHSLDPHDELHQHSPLDWQADLHSKERQAIRPPLPGQDGVHVPAYNWLLRRARVYASYVQVEWHSHGAHVLRRPHVHSPTRFCNLQLYQFASQKEIGASQLYGSSVSRMWFWQKQRPPWHFYQYGQFLAWHHLLLHVPILDPIAILHQLHQSHIAPIWRLRAKRPIQAPSQRP